MDCWKVLPSLGVILLAIPSALAGNVEVKERAAKKACLLGDFKKGVEILADLYLDTSDANYIFNQGRCFEQNGQNEPAILRFQEYLRKANKLSPDDASSVRMRIDVLQAAIDRRGKSASSEPVPVPVAAPVPAPGPTAPVSASIPPSAAVAPTPEATAITQSQPKPGPESSQPVYKRWWFWSGVGAVVAGGVVTAVLLSSKSAVRSPSCDMGATCVP